MGLLWRSAVVAVLTLAPMHVAWAECAWVLWEERFSIDFHRDTPGRTASTSEREWLISGATQDAKHCGSAAIAAAQKRAAQLRRTPSGTDHEGVTLDGTRVSIVGGGVALGFTYLCLPDTIDPRGPKGK